MIPPNPINANTYLPGVQVIPGDLLIIAITQAYPMAVSFINNAGNTYIAGQNVRLVIPTIYGMQQANGLTGTILSVDEVDYIFYLNINSTQFDPFIYSDIFGQIQPASMCPSGSSNLQYNNTTSQVAFQNLNNIGN